MVRVKGSSACHMCTLLQAPPPCSARASLALMQGTAAGHGVSVVCISNTCSTAWPAPPRRQGRLPGLLDLAQ